MCYLCTEVIKENLTPEEFWNNFHEIDDEHKMEVLRKASNTSEEYQLELANSALRDS